MSALLTGWADMHLAQRAKWDEAIQKSRHQAAFLYAVLDFRRSSSGPVMFPYMHYEHQHAEHSISC